MKLSASPLLFSFIILLCFFNKTVRGQNLNKMYEAQWKNVKNYADKGLSQSALAEVKKIYQLAKKENQEAQVIKAVVYMIDLQNENQENAEVNSITELEKEINTNKEPAKSILTCLLAKKYYQYYQQIRWQLYDRTATKEFKKEDISTWTTEDFHEKISTLYLHSISQEKLLKQTSLEGYNAIITKGNVRKLRPTLYDLLAQEALLYFSTDERNIKKPTYSFEINSASAYDPAADFIHRKFETKDTTSLEFYALKLYQKLIAFHINDKNADALIDVDLQRLQYVKQKSVHPDSDELYFMSVNHVADHYQTTPAAAQAWYLTAFWHNEKSYNSPNQDTTNRFEKVKAVEICEKIIKQNPETEGGINAYNLLQSIKQKSLQYTTETVNVPGKPFLTHVEYQNITRLYLRLIPATDDLRIKMQKGPTPENLHLLSTFAPIRTWTQDLIDTKDYQQHSVEIKVDALPVGEYFLIAADNPDLENLKTVAGTRLFYVSNISYVQKADDFFVLNRETGQPLSQAKVKIWEARYDYSIQSYLKLKSSSLVTDFNGYFTRKKITEQNNPVTELLEITHEKDRLFLQSPAYTYYQSQNSPVEIKPQTYLFTDRSIYRPGQVVYYKGIVAKGDSLLSLLDKDSDIPVVLKNANGEEVEKTIVHVNDYGSFSGKFQLPQNALNGEFFIYADDRMNKSIHVEEYKRPKFSVAYDTIKATYQLNDSIQIAGTAIAYAGNAIDGAKVSYRVVRNARFIYPWLSKRWFEPIQHLEITHGETITDQAGKFSISFTAIPDLKINKKFDPVFDYTVYADITDGNGETRSGQTNVSVGYKSIILTTDIPEKIQADSLKNLSIKTENMNGAFSASDVKVKITRLKPETRLLKKRLWLRPDLFVISKTEFISFFPNDEYDNESDQESWPEENVVFEKTAKLIKDKAFELSETKFLSGFYKIEISTADKSGEEVKDLKYIELTDPNKNKTIRPEYLSTKSSKSIEPGEKTIIEIGTSAENIFVISSSNRKEKNAKPFTFFPLNNEKRTFNFSATENDRGGYGIDFLFVKHNRIYTFSDVIQIPWNNKELKIEYVSFRDKTLPGSQEKWKIKLTGLKKEKIAAEMLASMYDASLDQFYPHKWNKPAIWKMFVGLQPWNSYQNFSFENANVKYDYSASGKTLDKRYDGFMWEGFYGRGNLRSKGSVVELKEAVIAGKSMVGGNSLKFSVAGLARESDATPMQMSPAPTIEQAKGQKEKNNYTRKNFNETAFFFPDLLTNDKGEIEFSFTIPEALTRWKFQALAHTKELALGYSSKEIVTQKDLMVQPNPPRFLREGDKISFSSKVVNLTDKELSGTVAFQLFDTETNKSVDEIFSNTSFTQSFILKGKESKALQFPIEVPENFTKTLKWRIIAKSGSYSDGEENFLPVLSNRILVTETLPLSIRGNVNKDYKFEKLINSGNSKTITNQSLTAEFTTNPAWYAVQSLPYLAESRFDCAEQIWNRYYANALAANIVSLSPRISKVFETWRTADTTALLSNLQKNQELKSILLEETPWVLAAKTESQQKKNIALLFDLNKISNELQSNLGKLEQMQNSNGAFSWFKGGPDDRYMTQYILSGIGHLSKINTQNKNQDKKLETIMRKGIQFLDQKIKEDYDLLVKQKTDLNKVSASPSAIQYLYMRSFFPEIEIPKTAQKAWTYFRERAKLSWLTQSKYIQGLTALALYRTNEKEVPKAILKSLKETAITNEETGMYWKNNQKGWWWYEAPIERHALLIEAFQEITNDTKTVNDLKTWLLKYKQTNNWESTKATAEASYALLLQGSDILNQESVVNLNLGELSLKSSDQKQEVGTGYFKTIIDGTKVKPEMGNVTVEMTTKSSSNLPGWGAVYWQYFENIDKVTSAETSLKLSKKLFIEKNSDNGPLLTPVNEGDNLHVGDKINVRIEFRADRDMEYVHMKDLRAAAFEPVNVLSGYHWQGGLGYYQSTRDASTDFFFDHLRKGTYVFEYPLFVTHDGNFANGITNIECMYAPEFSGHSDGVRVEIGR